MSALKSVLGRLPGVRGLAHKLRDAGLDRADEALRREYLSASKEPKLQIGGGWHKLDGWLNTDLGAVPGAMRMDATRRYPFADGAFKYIYSEHMIEHVPQPMGLAMLKECHRVLDADGVVRIVTPDLSVIAGLYTQTPSELQSRYLAFFHEAFADEGYPKTPEGAINAQFRLWGHQYIYDEAGLRDVMAQAGFTAIERVRLGQSAHTPLQGLENQERYPEGLLEFESVALEARKGPAS